MFFHQMRTFRGPNSPRSLPGPDRQVETRHRLNQGFAGHRKYPGWADGFV